MLMRFKNQKTNKKGELTTAKRRVANDPQLLTHDSATLIIFSSLFEEKGPWVSDPPDL